MKTFPQLEAEMDDELEKDAGIRSAYQAAGKVIKNRAVLQKNLVKNAPRKGVTEKVIKGYEHAAKDSGDSGSILSYLPQLAAEKAVGKEKVRDFLWKNLHGPALKADIAAGEHLSKIPFLGKKLFHVKDKVPYGNLKAKGGPDLEKTITRASALGPLTKARDLAEPILVGVGTERGINHLKKMNEERKKNKSEGPKAMGNSKLHEKVASALVRLRDENRDFVKRAHATRLLWKEVEMGLASPPGTFDEYQEKIASMVNEDLTVLERALEMSGSRHSLGEVQGTSLGRTSAEQSFMDAYLDNDS